MLIALVLIVVAVGTTIAAVNRWREERQWRDKRLPSPVLFARDDPKHPLPTPTAPLAARGPVGAPAHQALPPRLDRPVAGGSTADLPFAHLAPPSPSSLPVADETIQVLPGRLEVLAGDPRHREIRFVRVPGRPPELILGREPGDSAQHVTLGSTTVSRRHARFAFLDGGWTVMNLSRTNPILINGAELPSNDASHDLCDGDRIELGEVVLRFTYKQSLR